MSVTVILFYGGFAINNLIQYLYPTFTISTTIYERHTSNELYERHLIKMSRITSGARVMVAERLAITEKAKIERMSAERSNTADISSYIPMTGSELTRNREESWKSTVAKERKRGIKGFVRESVTTSIAFIILFIHWKIANRQKQLTKQATGQ